MNTLATTKPCGDCLPCKAGKHCAHVLVLSPEDRRGLELVRRVIPEPTGRAVNIKPIVSISAARAAQPEPTVTDTCPRCDGPRTFLAFVVATAKLRGFALPPCEACHDDMIERRERADLR